MRCKLKRVDVVDALSRKTPFAVQVLIDVGHCSRIRINTRMTRGDGCKAASVRTRQRDTNPRLQYAIAAHNAPSFGVIDRAIEWMCHRTNERRRGVGRQHRIGVEGDDVANRGQRGCVATNDRECVACSPPQPEIEVGKFATLALPTHPDLVMRVPTTRSMQEVKHILLM